MKEGERHIFKLKCSRLRVKINVKPWQAPPLACRGVTTWDAVSVATAGPGADSGLCWKSELSFQHRSIISTPGWGKGVRRAPLCPSIPSWASPLRPPEASIVLLKVNPD